MGQLNFFEGDEDDVEIQQRMEDIRQKRLEEETKDVPTYEPQVVEPHRGWIDYIPGVSRYKDWEERDARRFADKIRKKTTEEVMKAVIGSQKKQWAQSQSVDLVEAAGLEGLQHERDRLRFEKYGHLAAEPPFTKEDTMRHAELEDYLKTGEPLTYNDQLFHNATGMGLFDPQAQVEADRLGFVGSVRNYKIAREREANPYYGDDRYNPPWMEIPLERYPGTNQPVGLDRPEEGIFKRMKARSEEEGYPEKEEPGFEPLPPTNPKNLPPKWFAPVADEDWPGLPVS